MRGGELYNLCHKDQKISSLKSNHDSVREHMIKYYGSILGLQEKQPVKNYKVPQFKTSAPKPPPAKPPKKPQKESTKEIAQEFPQEQSSIKIESYEHFFSQQLEDECKSQGRELLSLMNQESDFKSSILDSLDDNQGEAADVDKEKSQIITRLYDSFSTLQKRKGLDYQTLFLNQIKVDQG